MLHNTTQDLRRERYRFKLVVDELRSSAAAVDFHVTVFAFINCVILATDNLRDRCRVRNEFIGGFCN